MTTGSPSSQLPGSDTRAAMLERLEGATRDRFKIKADVPEIKRVDRALLAAERRAFSRSFPPAPSRASRYFSMCDATRCSGRYVRSLA